MLKTALRLALLAAALTSLGACAEHKAPTIDGVCYHMVENKDGSLKFNPLADHVPNIETCAQRLEIMRLSFLKLGGSHLDLTGAYQGQFIWLERGGVSVSQSLDGIHYALLKRMPDGSLAVHSAVPQP